MDAPNTQSGSENINANNSTIHITDKNRKNDWLLWKKKCCLIIIACFLFVILLTLCINKIINHVNTEKRKPNNTELIIIESFEGKIK